MNYQKIIVLGQLGKDAEIRNFPNGGGVLNMSVATSENWQKDGEWQSKTTWHNVKVFGKSIDYLAPKCLKGASVLVDGILNVDEYEKDGVKKYNTFIKANSVKVLNAKQDGYQGQLQEQAGVTAEDLPF